MMIPRQRVELPKGKRHAIHRVPACMTAALTLMLYACGTTSNSPVATATGPQVYMSPSMAGIPAAGSSVTGKVATYSIDEAKATLAQTTYGFSNGVSGAQVQYAGMLCAPASRGFQSLSLTYPASTNSTGGCPAIAQNLAQPGGWALELAGQAGGLAEIAGQPFVPLVAANTCPSMKTPETFLFVTLPEPPSKTGLARQEWDPQTETAYGTVQISASGSTVTLGNIAQYTLPSSGGSGAPGNPSAASVTGVCATTSYGNTVSIPGQITATDPGSTSEATTPQALLGIGPSGLLVEDNGTATAGFASKPPYYESVLGAGTGAIGLPQPSSAVSANALVGAQYLGFVYGAGSSSSDWSSTPVSFGFSSQPSACTSIAPQTSTMLYGGDYSGGNPANSATGYGNCDFAIDLGTQDANTNGLYPAATVYLGSGFAANTTGKTYSFQAVAIAGQLNGKYAIFLIGMDTAGTPNQPWGIYLLQSN